jgi:signal transduction histidine kinase
VTSTAITAQTEGFIDRDAPDAPAELARWKRANDRLSRLYQIGKVLTRIESVDRTMAELLKLVGRSTPLRTALLLLEDPLGRRPTEVRLWHAAGLSPARRRAAGDHAQASHAYLVPDARPADVEEQIVGLLAAEDIGPATPEPPVTRFVVLPLVVDRNAIFGVLQVEGIVPLDEDDLRFVDAVANHLAIALDRFAAAERRHAGAANATMAAELLAVAASRSERAQRFLAETSVLLANSLDEREVRAAIVHAAVPLLADLCILDSIDDGGHAERLDVVFADPTQSRFIERLFALGPATALLESGRSLLVPVLSSPVGYPAAHHEVLTELGARSLMVVPLIARGRTLGALTLISTSPRYFDRDDLAVAQDMAGRGALASMSARLYEKAELAVQARDDLLAIVSHDLKNPLAVVLMSTQLLRATPLGDDPMSSKRLVAILRSAGRMERIIADLLDLARLSNGRLTVVLQPHSIAGLIQEAVDGFQDEAAAKGVRIEASSPDPSLAVSCDRGRLLQVLGNLIGNAVKFTPAGGSIAVSARETAPETRFFVTDNGAGIEPGELPHIFDRYWQARRTAHLGTGLGLSIAKALVEAHGGTISAVSQTGGGPGGGSTFSFTIPHDEARHGPTQDVGP